jgi:hypothetical protein
MARRFLPLVLSLAALALTAPAHARTWTIGPNLDVGTRTNDDGGDNVTSIALPATVSGLRVGFPTPQGSGSLFFDTGLALTSGGGARSNHYSLVGNLQWVFAPRAELTPYVNGGAGLRFVSYRTTVSARATSLAYGLGVGLRQRWGESASVRGEFRLDRVTKGDDGAIVVIPGGREYGFRLGFDLWVK